MEEIPERYLPRTWVNPKVVVGNSAIQGRGVFAREPIAPGEKVMVFGGEFISRDQAFSGRYRSNSIWNVAPDRYLALPTADPAESLDEYLNHSCDANSWLTDEVTIAARHTIEAGDEITLDQGTWNFEYADYTDRKEACSCGAPDCRKHLTERDWQLPAVRERYRGHFHPLVQALIDSQAG
jgi:hypothetical protein